VSVYVGFRISHPDESIKNDTLKGLKDNNIDAGKLLLVPANHCPKA
jgi:hypothetical protein